jgi:hypothetical protein
VRKFLTLIILISLSTGCITKRGKKVDTSNLIQLPNGTWSLTPRAPVRPLPRTNSSQEITPVQPTPPQSKPVKLPPAKVKPTPTTPESVIANIDSVRIKPAEGKLEPLTPTVSATPQKLPPFPSVDTTPVTGEEATNESEIAGPSETAPPPAVKVNWTDLFMFYLWCAIIILTVYLIYKSKTKKVYNKKNESTRTKKR